MASKKCDDRSRHFMLLCKHVTMAVIVGNTDVLSESEYSVCNNTTDELLIHRHKKIPMTSKEAKLLVTTALSFNG